MSEMQAVVGEVSRKIEALENNRRKLVKAIREIKDFEFRVGDLTRDRVINPVKKVKVNCKVCGVDGGLQARSFHGIDVIVVRAVGVCMNYADGRVESVKYYQPPAPRVLSAETASDAELVFLSGIHRMIEEAGRVVEVIREESPDYLLLDGPIYPHPSTSAAKTMYPDLYRRVISLYDSIIRESEKVGTRVVGVVEDSRSKYLSRILKEKIIPSLPSSYTGFPKNVHEFRDTSLLFGALKEGERTFAFKVSGIIDVFYRDRIFAFYLKTVRYDRPVRVEVASSHPADIIDDVASLVRSLAGFSRYGIPSVLIEADARAHLTEYYMNYVERLLSSSTPLLMNLRRESRPI